YMYIWRGVWLRSLAVGGTWQGISNLKKRRLNELNELVYRAHICLNGRTTLDDAT
ncbi:hypothetical protein ACJX0J_040389, partial [Zea mays]